MTEDKTIYNIYLRKKVFLVLKNEIFYNGIIEQISDNFLIINDRKVGKTTISIDSIKRIEPREEIL